jgi:hypothetical protein
MLYLKGLFEILENDLQKSIQELPFLVETNQYKALYQIAHRLKGVDQVSV